MTLIFDGWPQRTINRAPLLCYFKLCASFRSHWWIQLEWQSRTGLGSNTFYQIQIQIQKIGFFKYKYKNKYFIQHWFKYKYKYKYIDSNTNTNTFNQIYLPKLCRSKIGQFYESQDIYIYAHGLCFLMFRWHLKIINPFAVKQISLTLEQLGGRGREGYLGVG